MRFSEIGGPRPAQEQLETLDTIGGEFALLPRLTLSSTPDVGRRPGPYLARRDARHEKASVLKGTSTYAASMLRDAGAAITKKTARINLAVSHANRCGHRRADVKVGFEKISAKTRWMQAFWGSEPS